ncbi:hypothetical protein M9H77_11614 [Catharanthus roseus]|uniref:Uncharacterized protein n=1 Tax=Catharanthus roseus TaxID=4058 RepID=A0ACC0BF58_CATRO|nr:hypothetical protein M9H77_11614 [Catharanthus roseus]
MPTPMAHHGSTIQIWLASHLKEGRKTFGKHKRWMPRSSDKFWHLVVNTSLNSKAHYMNVRFFNLTQHIHKQVMSSGVLTKPPCATLAGGPLLTQPSRNSHYRRA